MTPESTSILILASLLSGLVGALASIYVYGKREKRQFKLFTLKDFAANRFDITGIDFSKVLNEIVVVFNDSPAVLRALNQFHEAITQNLGTQAIAVVTRIEVIS
ncbi:MAG: hypothetical protein AAGJ10_15555 [Bacteroidota bacterium]